MMDDDTANGGTGSLSSSSVASSFKLLCFRRFCNKKTTRKYLRKYSTIGVYIGRMSKLRFKFKWHQV
jgi:hypothetical protein